MTRSEVVEPLIGFVIHAVGGTCEVHTSAGVLQCSLRGRIKKDVPRLLPGDRVRVSPLNEREGVVEDVLPRRTELQRPYIANVDQVVIVMSLAEPPPSLDLLDRLLVIAYHVGLRPVIVWNKIDLVEPSVAEVYDAVYRTAGFRTVATSPKEDRGRKDLGAELAGHVTVLAGASGVGKSSILNWLLGEERFATGEVSARLGRGRHTTRSVRFVPWDGDGWIADSPGFSVLDLSGILPEDLPSAYPDMAELQEHCRFSGCLHRTEPSCAVREAVERGEFDKGRYERYLRILAELEEYEARRYS